MSSANAMNYNLFKSRRNILHSLISDSSIDEYDNALIILFGNFENDRYVFRQESSFYYLTGIEEPGVVLFSFKDGREFLYIPQYSTNREIWLNPIVNTSAECAKKFELSEIKYLGMPAKGYSFSPIFSDAEYKNLISDLGNIIKTGIPIFTIFDDSSTKYLTQLQCCQYLLSIYPELEMQMNDISSIIHQMRRIKDNFELAQINHAVQITSLAHEVAAGSVRAGIYENQIQAQIEHVFTSMRGTCAFPSIVATGKHSTVLHYTQRNQELKTGDLVVIDIGCEYSYYASDISRTYPVGGVFSPRQRNIYDIVLDVQEYIESCVKPEMFLRNSAIPEKSLHHLAVAYLEKLGYAQYFPHGIGHFLGLDVHDVGDYNIPLEIGDVITIEPGIYIPQENIGIRIEDNYVVVEDGCICISTQLPRKANEIETLVSRSNNLSDI